MTSHPSNDPKVEAGIAKILATKTKAANKQTPPGLLQIIQPNARDRWMGSTASQFTPQRIEQVLRSAMNGDLVAQWELFDLMEDTWPRLTKNLNELKRAVKGYDRNFEPWSEEEEAAIPDADKRAKVVSRACWTMQPNADENENGFDDTIYDILDAWGKGIAVLEVDWETRASGKFGLITAPRATRYIHPRFYSYPANQNWLGLNTQEISMAIATGARDSSTPAAPPLQPVDGLYARFPKNKFLICVCKAKSGHPSVTALLRPLAFWWAASNFAQEWLLNFAQIFGLPIRWANYDPNVPGLMDKVAAMLENMGSAAWAAFPTGTNLELKEPMKAGADNPQITVLDRAEKQCDILILGQTLTTDVGDSGSRALGDVHKTVRDDIVEAAADFVANVINQQLIPAIIELNFGDRQLLPEICFEPETDEDTAKVATTLKTATDIGVRIPANYAHKRLGIPLPTPDEEVLEPRPAAPTGFPGEMPGVATAHGKAAHDETLLNHVLEDLTGVEARWLGGVKPAFRELLVKAKNNSLTDAELIAVIERAQKEMPTLFDRLDTKSLASTIEGAMGAAAVNGAVRGYVKRGGAR